MIAFAIIGLHAASTHPETCSDEIEQLAATMVHKEPAYGLFKERAIWNWPKSVRMSIRRIRNPAK